MGLIRRLAAVGLLLACKHPAATTADAGDHRTTAPVSNGPVGDSEEPTPYRVDPPGAVGAVISGRVVWRGARPALDELPVHAMGNPDICGHSQPFQALMLGADGAVANTVVYLSDINHGVAPARQSVTIDQHHCRYFPHVSAAALGAELLFTNHDEGLMHNVHAYYGEGSDGDSWFNAATPVNVGTSRRALRTGVVRLLCDAGHTWMNGYVHVFTHPYFAVTREDGRFEIPGVPAGNYSLTLWHEGWRLTGTSQAVGAPRPEWSPSVTHVRRVAVTAGGRVGADFTLGADGFAD